MFLVKEFCPPNKPDPLDYFFLWGIIERFTNKPRHAKRTILRATIEATFADMDKNALQRACQRFRLRIEAVIKAKATNFTLKEYG